MPLGSRGECSGRFMRLGCKFAGDCCSMEQMLMCRIMPLDASTWECLKEEERAKFAIGNTSFFCLPIIVSKITQMKVSGTRN